jgi:hypothetical protein
VTVYVHKINSAVGYGGHHHIAPADIGGRTWTFECDVPGCEERILRDVEHSGRNEASVPLTQEEEAQEEQDTRTAGRDVAQLAAALGQMAKDNKASPQPVTA